MEEATKIAEAVASEAGLSLSLSSSLSVSLPIGGGPRKTISLAKKDIHPALIFAQSQDGAQSQNGVQNSTQNTIELAGYKQVTDSLLDDERWSSRRVFISSPAAKDGKTITAFNLAWALSMRKKSVLLAELNFARPRFRSMLGQLRIRYGIDSALHGAVKPEESIFSVGSEGSSDGGSDGLHISAVRDTLKTTETARHLNALNGFLIWASSNYDWLILDCPPVLSRAWTTWFQRQANPVLMVARAGHTPLLQVRKAERRLGASLQGSLLNDFDESDAPKAAVEKITPVSNPSPETGKEPGASS